MYVTIRGARATDIVINITMLRSWHSSKMPNLSGLCILNDGMYIRSGNFWQQQKKFFRSGLQVRIGHVYMYLHKHYDGCNLEVGILTVGHFD
jgi:hypothetical protein